MEKNEKSFFSCWILERTEIRFVEVKSLKMPLNRNKKATNLLYKLKDLHRKEKVYLMDSELCLFTAWAKHKTLPAFDLRNNEKEKFDSNW